MRRFHAFVTGVLVAGMFISFQVTAEPILIDPDTASYEEIVAAIDQLKSVQIDMLKEQYVNDKATPQKSTITFRDVPWHSTPSETAEILGEGDYRYGGTFMGARYYEGVGIETNYYEWDVAGYPVHATACYVFPVQNDKLLQDNDLAELFYAEYRIDTKDSKATSEDLAGKLCGLYGDYTITDNGYYAWEDEEQNTVTMKEFGTEVDLCYSVADAEEIMETATAARNTAIAEEEAIERVKNQNNSDGL